MVNKIEDNNIIKYRTYALIVNSSIIDKAIRETIRVINTKTIELIFIILKFIYKVNIIRINFKYFLHIL